ncbi:hypothetical protein PVAND_002903 [Polypedilum vanderplanki]|uniref:Uncharacterized protein n=1 Tax=Polypedilum vanderplanki TaxID=319348 RepID=A0A9J6BTA5_POLVA|nr:hypothetical protein PVAND_002903 [Polypedilum vanderplanki]
MELENYEANLADIALQEQTFYETKPTLYELQMASQLMNTTLTAQNGHSGTFNSPSTFPLLTPIINNSGKGKKKKSVKFLTYVQGYDGEAPMLLKEEPEDGPRSIQKVPSLSDLSEESIASSKRRKKKNHENHAMFCLRSNNSRKILVKWSFKMKLCLKLDHEKCLDEGPKCCVYLQH